MPISNVIKKPSRLEQEFNKRAQATTKPNAFNSDENTIPPHLRGRGLDTDSDEVLDFLLNPDGTPRRKRDRLQLTESDCDGGNNSDSSSPLAQNTSQKRKNIRPHSVLKIVDGAPLQSPMLNSNGERDHKTADTRDNFTLQGVTDPKTRELWKRCFEVIILDHIQRGPVEHITDAENGFIEPMVRDIRKRYYQMFGDDSPELTGACWGFAGRVCEWVISFGLNLYGLTRFPDDIREKRCKKLLKDMTFVWRTCDETIRRGKFQHPAIIAGIGKLYFGRGMKNAIGNVKPCDDVTALQDNLSAGSVVWICLGLYWGIMWTKSSPNLAGIEFRPKSMLQVWSDLLNALQKKSKTLMELQNIAMGMDRQVAAKEVEYDLGYCQTDSDPDI